MASPYFLPACIRGPAAIQSVCPEGRGPPGKGQERGSTSHHIESRKVVGTLEKQVSLGPTSVLQF